MPGDVEHGTRERADGDLHQHERHLGDGRPGERALRVRAHRAGGGSDDDADDRQHERQDDGDIGTHEDRAEAEQQEAGTTDEAGVHQRRHRRRGIDRADQPPLERHDRRPARSRNDQQDGDDVDGGQSGDRCRLELGGCPTRVGTERPVGADNDHGDGRGERQIAHCEGAADAALRRAGRGPTVCVADHRHQRPAGGDPAGEQEQVRPGNHDEGGAGRDDTERSEVPAGPAVGVEAATGELGDHGGGGEHHHEEQGAGPPDAEPLGVAQAAPRGETADHEQCDRCDRCEGAGCHDETAGVRAFGRVRVRTDRLHDQDYCTRFHVLQDMHLDTCNLVQYRYDAVMSDERPRRSWTFLTNHAHVLLAIARTPDLRVREIAELVGVTERTAMQIVVDLEDAGYITRERHGRRNHYRVRTDRHLRHPLEEHHDVDALLEALAHEPITGRTEAV